MQDSGTYYVHTQKGVEHHTQFYIPKMFVKSFDGRALWFSVTEADSAQFAGTRYPTDDEYRMKYEKQAQQAPPVTTVASTSTTATSATTVSTASAASAVSTPSDIVERIPLITERLDVNKHIVKENAIITKIPYTERETRDVQVMHEEIRLEVRNGPSSNTAPVNSPVTSPEVITIPLEHEEVDITKTPEVRQELVVHRTPVIETLHISEEIRGEKFKTSENIATTDNTATATALEEEKEQGATA